MRVPIIKILMVLSLLLVVSACSNEKTVQNTKESKSEVKTAAMDSKKVGKPTTEAEKTGTFTVLGMDCCPPSVVTEVLNRVKGVGKTDIKVSDGKAEVTVSYDDKKTDLNSIKTAVSDFGLPVE
ncbi:mercury resistance system substrate-binding protein MerP [Bacillaceae bacterium C204]|uniref:mercury resistance system substrate-binding protein MerP n=1 Tax=Neobacillus sp. 204 TaxID=3383351 RepID=UPI00397D482E